MKEKNVETNREDDAPAEVQELETTPVTRDNSKASETEEKLTGDFLLAEYNALVELYTHTEDALPSTFNFYLTLLSAVVGALLVLPQLPAMAGAAIFPTTGFLLSFAVLLGIITEEGIVNKNVDLAHYAHSINLLKAYVLSSTPEARQRIFYLRNLFIRINPHEAPSNTIDRLHKRLWWMIPLGTHQLFVSNINSLALTVLVIVVIPGLLSVTLSPLRMLVGGVIGTYLFFVAHCIYAQVKFRQGFRKSEITMAGKAPEW